MFHSPRHRQALHRLALSRALSLTALTAANTALIYAVFDLTRSSWWVSGTLALTFGVSSLLGPLSGNLGDRFDRRSVMVGSQVVTALAYVLLAAATLSGSVSAILVAGFLYSVAQTPFPSAAEAAVPNLVEPDGLTRANSTVAVGRNVGFLVGPGLSGILLGVLGPGAVFLACGPMVLAAVVLLLAIDVPLSRDDDPPRGLRAGLDFIWHDAVLRRLTGTWALVLGLIGPVLVAELELVAHFGAGSLGYALLGVFWSAGSLIGSLAGKRLGRRAESRAILGGPAAMAVCFTLIGLVPVFWPVLLLLCAGGGADGLGTVAEQNVTARRVPDGLRSRVWSATDATVMGSMGLGFVLGGPLVAAFGYQVAYFASAAGAALGVLLLLPLRRGLSEEAQLEAAYAAAPARRPEAERVLARD
jgi:MFS family permease